MFHSIKGKIKYKGESFLAVETGPISWQVYVTEYLRDKVKPSQELMLYTYLYSRQDTLELYGFEDIRELEFFKHLISISGIGPKTAIGVLSVARLKDLRRAIRSEDATILTKVSGIGKKTAERIILELKSKISEIPGEEVGKGKDEDVVDALVGLGYKIADIRQALRQIPEEVEGAQERIRAALKILAR